MTARMNSHTSQLPVASVDESRTHERLTSIGRELKRLTSDLEMARRIQRRLLPVLRGQVGGLRVAAEYRPAFQVGGDFYDLIPLDDGGMLAVIGDVSGKGIAAALIMARVTSELRRLAQSCASPATLLAELNRLLVDIGSDDAFVTAACLRFDAARTRVAVANAGHVPPVVRRADGTTSILGEASGAPLAMLPEEQYRDQEFTLERGDVVLLMTDGITEGVDACACPLEMSRLLELVHDSSHDVAAICARILAEVERGRARRVDDQAILALQVAA
jgi:serine phosphatase RsbU (regulator of sigma subunit)